MKTGKVSVVMPCFNSAAFMHDSIESVLAQTYDNIELLLVDNGSFDQTVDIARQYCAQDARVRLLHCQQKGAAHARNFGIDVADGQYIAFLDSDDLWERNKLEVQLGCMRSYQAAFCWSSYFVIDESRTLVRTQKVAETVSYSELLQKKAVIGCLTAVYDVQQLGKCYMPVIRMRQDFGLFLKILRMCEEKELTCRGVVAPLASYRMHSGSMTANKIRAAYYQWRLYRDVESIGILTAFRLMTVYALRGLKDRLSR